MSISRFLLLSMAFASAFAGPADAQQQKGRQSQQSSSKKEPRSSSPKEEPMTLAKRNGLLKEAKMISDKIAQLLEITAKENVQLLKMTSQHEIDDFGNIVRGPDGRAKSNPDKVTKGETATQSLVGRDSKTKDFVNDQRYGAVITTQQARVRRNYRMARDLQPRLRSALRKVHEANKALGYPEEDYNPH